jgi:ATP-binding cassette subfamily G (WHITE) protein 2 (SNQ2)
MVLEVGLFNPRERSGVGYNPLALYEALVAVEIPLAISIYTMAFLCSWFTIGLGYAGFGYINFLAFGLFGIGFPSAIASLAGYTNSLLWCIMAVFGGVAIPHQSMNDFYRPWLFWANPLRYWLGATISAAVHNVPVRCAEHEMILVEPPAESTCGEYLSAYIDRVAGYVLNPNTTEACAYCAYSVGDDYEAQYGFFFSERWRDWSVFTAFCISTLGIAFLVTWIRHGKMFKPFK